MQTNLQLPATKRLLQMRQDLLYHAAPLQGHRMICQRLLSCLSSSLRHQLLLMLLLGVQQQHCHLSNNIGILEALDCMVYTDDAGFLSLLGDAVLNKRSFKSRYLSTNQIEANHLLISCVDFTLGVS